jgi:tRNA A-37 threonylcarbamoyl transferase component Bud32
LNQSSSRTTHRVGRYRVLRELGRGATACVYEAEHEELGKRVALKVLHPELRANSIAMERFSREGRVAAGLVHPHVVDVYDVSLQTDCPHLVMELVDGPSLADFLVAERRLHASRAADLLLPVLSAVAYAHAAGVVHRDLKPSNVVVGTRREGLDPKVTDFGVGKVTSVTEEQRLTLDGCMVGSPPYMAPEQADCASTVDERADQYAIGVIFYELVTGRPPFRQAATHEVIRAIRAGDHVPACEADPEVPRALSDVLRRAMSLDPAERYPSVAALAREILPFSSPRTWARFAGDFRTGDGPDETCTLDGGARPGDAGDAWASTRPPFASASQRSRLRWVASAALLSATALGAAATHSFAARGQGAAGAQCASTTPDDVVAPVQPSLAPQPAGESAPARVLDGPPQRATSPAAAAPSSGRATVSRTRSAARSRDAEAAATAAQPENDVDEYGANQAPIIR